MNAAYPEYQGYNVSTGRHHTNIHSKSSQHYERNFDFWHFHPEILQEL